MSGGMGERFNPAVLKTVEPERVPGVRIPLPPPDHKCPDRTHGLGAFLAGPPKRFNAKRSAQERAA
jgi:hypothetical protein